MKYNILVEGPYLTQSGYGEHARLVLESLRGREEVEIFGLPLQWGKTSWLSFDTDQRKWFDEISQKLQTSTPENFDLHVFVGIPSEFEKKAEKAICVTAGIEVDRVSPNWLVKTYDMDKMIVPSVFSKEVFKNTSYTTSENPEKPSEVQTLECKTEIDVIPYSVRTYEPDDNFEINLKDNFNFLCVAQWGPRKNLENTIAWFLQEFRDESVGLVLKTNFARNCNIDYEMSQTTLKRLLRQIDPDNNRKCSLYLLHGDLSEEQMGSLYTHKDIKAIISATHGEGFGLPLFEAACHGLPVVAPNATGHVDFLYAKNKKKKIVPHFAKVEFSMVEVPENFLWEDIIERGSRWLEPDENSFKTNLRDVYRDHRKYVSFAKNLKKNILETHNKTNICDRFAESILSTLEKDLEDLNLKVFS